MFDQILQLVKEHLSGNPQVSSAIPAGQEHAVHNKIASHITNGLTNRDNEALPIHQTGLIMVSVLYDLSHPD